MASAPGKKLKVALVQMKPKALDPEHNFAHAKSELKKAASQGASLAILPEYHLSGWEPNDPKFVAHARESQKYLQAYQDLAAELKINICAGTFVKTTPETIDSEDPTLINVCAFISETGEVLGEYVKTNIWIPEREHLTSSVAYAASQTAAAASDPPKTDSQTAKDLKHAGEAHSEPDPPSGPHSVIETSFGKIGILICWDLAFPEAFRSLIQQGCQLILIPTFWTALDMRPEGLAINPNAEKLFLESTLVARAFENTCTVVFCNAGGPSEEGYLGLSGVYAPIVGRVEGSFTDNEVGVRVVEIDFGVQELAEMNYRVREDLARDGWHYGYERSAAS